jgi:hypothetical protein
MKIGRLARLSHQCVQINLEPVWLLGLPFHVFSLAPPGTRGVETGLDHVVQPVWISSLSFGVIFSCLKTSSTCDV